MTRTEFIQKMAELGATPEQIKLGLQRRRSEIGLFDDEIDNNDLGSIASKYESGNDPSIISSGEGDIGGKSYGLFQLSTETGTLRDFLNTSGYANQFQGTIGSSNFDKKWKELSQDEEFNNKQKEYIINTHYKPVENYLRSKYGLDISQSKAVKELVYSTANQFGAKLAQKVFDEALSGKTELDEKTFIDSVIDVKLDTDRWFKSSPIETRQSVKNRFIKEREDLYGLITPIEQVTEQPTEQVVSSPLAEPKQNAWLGAAVEGLKAAVRNPISYVEQLSKAQKESGVTDNKTAIKVISDLDKFQGWGNPYSDYSKLDPQTIDWIQNLTGKNDIRLVTKDDIDMVRSQMESSKKRSLESAKSAAGREAVLSVITKDSLIKKGEYEKLNGVSGFFQDVVTNLPQMVSTVGVSLLNPLAGTALAASQIAGAQAEQLEESNVKAEDVVFYSTINALAQMPLEQLGLGKITDFIKGSGLVSKASKKFISVPMTEFLTEALQKYPEAITDIWAKSEGKTNEEKLKQFVSNFGQISKEAVYEGLVGAFTGSAVATVGKVTQPKQQNIEQPQQELQAVDERGNPVSTMTEPAQQLIDEQGEVDESPYIKSFDMTEEDLLSRYEYDKEGRNLLKSAVTTDPKIDEETRSRLLSEMDQIDNTTEEVIDEEESQETETLLNEQEPAVEPQSSQEATTPIPTTETSPNADLPSVETATEQTQPQEVVPVNEVEQETPASTPSYITKRDDGTVIVDKRNITDNEPLAQVLNSSYYNQIDEFTIEDIKNIIVQEYGYLKNYSKSDALDKLKKIKILEDLYEQMDDQTEYFNREQFLNGLNAFNYNKKQIEVITEFVNELKIDRFPKTTNQKLLGKDKANNFYAFAKNILSADNPDALIHEIGHYSLYNVLSSKERIEYMKYAIDRFNDKNINNDLALKNIELNNNTKVKTNVADDFDEYFAEQFRQYVIENKVTDSQFKTLFSRLKEYLDAILKAFRKTGYNKDLVKYFDKIIDGKKTNVELSQDQKKFISRLDVPKDKLSVAKEIVGNIDFSVPYRNASEEAKLGPKFKRLIRIIVNDPEFSIELNGEEVTLKDAIKGKTRQQMAEIADLAALGTELEAQGAGSTMKKQKRRQFVESITSGMEYTPELEQRIKKEFAGNKDFNFDKIFEVVTGEISRKEQNRVYKEAIAKGYSGDELTKYMTDELNKLPGKKVLLVKNPKKFAELKGEDVQSVDAKDIDIIYDKDVIDDKIKANVTEIKKKHKPFKQLTAKQKAETYVADKIKLRLTDRNIKIRFYDFVNKYLYGVGADSYRRQIFDLIEKVEAVDDVYYKKAMELVDEAIDYKKAHQAFVRVRAFKMKHKNLLKKSDPDYKKIATELESLEADYKKFVDYTTMKRLNDRGEVLKPKRKNKDGVLVSTRIGARYNSLRKQKFAEIIPKDGKEYYTLTDLGKKTFPKYKTDLTTVDGMFDAQRINSTIIAIKEEFKAVNDRVRNIKKEKKTETEIAVEDIGKQVSAKKRTPKQIKSANFWNYSENPFWRWVGSPRSLTNINLMYKAKEMDRYRDDGTFQKYITNPMAKNRRKVYENKNKLDDGLKEDVKKFDLSYKDIRRMSDLLSVGIVERLFAGDRKKRKRKVRFDNGEVEMSEAREVSLYLLAQSEPGYNHLVNGGFLIETDGGNTEPFVLTDNDILSLGKRLNARQKKLVKVIKSHFERQAEIGNEVSLADIGEKIFNEPNYFPILVHKDYLASDKQVVNTPEDLRQTFFKGLPSITKARQDSKQPIILEDPFIAIARTYSLFNQYMDMVMVTNKVWNIINNDKFRTMMIKNGYEAEFRAMYDDVKDMMTVKVKDSSEQALKIINSVFTVGVLGYKPSVSLSQPIATVLYFPEMDIGWREFVKASLDVRNWFSKAPVKELWELRNLIEKHSPYLKERFNNSMEVVMRGTQNRATAAQMFLGGKKLKRDHLKFILSSRGAMSWIQDMDTSSIMGIWKLLEVEAVAKGYKRGTAEFNNYVARRTEYITQMTQQTFDTFDSPPLARTTLGRLTTRFLSQSLKSGMMLRKQMYKLGDGELSVKDRTKAGLNALGIILSQSVAVELMKVGIKAVGGGFEDDEWKTLEYWAMSLSTNVLTLFGTPGIVLGGILGGYGNVGGGNFGALTERIGDTYKKLVRAINNQDANLAVVAVYELAKTFLPIGGPEQLYKFAVGLVEMWGVGR